jgi:hypothetical protein
LAEVSSPGQRGARGARGQMSRAVRAQRSEHLWGAHAIRSSIPRLLHCSVRMRNEGEANGGGDGMAVVLIGVASDRGQRGIARNKHTKEPQPHSRGSAQFYIAIAWA